MTTASVWKFKIGPDVTVLEMPRGAKALRVGVQGNEVFLWALVRLDVSLEKRAFLAVGTGHRHPAAAFGEYIGTVDYPGGLVFHVFEATDLG